MSVSVSVGSCGYMVEAMNSRSDWLSGSMYKYMYNHMYLSFLMLMAQTQPILSSAFPIVFTNNSEFQYPISPEPWKLQSKLAKCIMINKSHEKLGLLQCANAMSGTALIIIKQDYHLQFFTLKLS